MTETETDAKPEEKPDKDPFPERLYCPQCKRLADVKLCKTRYNTILTETQILCPRCRRRLKRMKLKDWYDHYIHRQIQAPAGQPDE